MQLGQGMLKMSVDVLEKVCVKITNYNKSVVVHETMPIRVFNFKTSTLLHEETIDKDIVGRTLGKF